MSLMEGGGFECMKDGFKTTDVNEWNEHCGRKEGNLTHIVEEGVTACNQCHKSTQYKMPWFPYNKAGTKTINVLCKDCQAMMSYAVVGDAK